jgi:hypothetical protein
MPSNKANKVIFAYVGISMIIIVFLGCLVANSNKSCSPYAPRDSSRDSSRDMCLCNRAGRKLCANRYELEASYDKGNTEYQNFAGMQKEAGGPFWSDTNFSNY